jgi:hypothetical protein
MAEPHVVSALVAKRGELAGEVQRHRRELRQLDEQLGHLDAAIRLFAPDYDLSSVRPRQRRVDRQRFGQGECQRLGLETLRDAREPLSDRQIETAVLTSKGAAAGSQAGAPPWRRPRWPPCAAWRRKARSGP